ncbi:MAG: gamma-glutamyl-gamma-aminobutyrate hydrolase family protein [Bdellovibrionota bacterium]
MIHVALSANRLPADPLRDLYRGKELEYLESTLVQRLADLNTLPLMVPTLSGLGAVREFASLCDGLVLSGGADVCPLSYGRRKFDPRWPGDRRRDLAELALIAAFRRAKKPILGVCRGVQILNVAYGGTLYQDLPSERPTWVIHRDSKRYDRNRHRVTLEGGTLLSRLARGRREVTVNTVHHQGIKDLGRGLRPIAWSEDGLVEATEDPRARFIVGIQWHPEWTAVRSEIPGSKLFGAFLAACRKP